MHNTDFNNCQSIHWISAVDQVCGVIVDCLNQTVFLLQVDADYACL